MAATATTATTRADRSASVGRARAAVWRHPEWPLAAIAALAWVWLAVDHWANHDRVNVEFSFDVVSWTAMVAAMMLPGVLPMARYVAFNSLWRRRNRAVALFVVAYVAVWVGLGLAAWGAIATAQSLTGWDARLGTTALVMVGVVAIGWQLGTGKHRALRRCHLRKPLGARGWPADRAVLRYGVFHGRACAGSCWAIMAMMFVAQHDFHLMVPLAIVTVVERYQRRPHGAPGAAAIAFALLLSIA